VSGASGTGGERYGPGLVPAAVRAGFAICFGLLMLKPRGGELWKLQPLERASTWDLQNCGKEFSSECLLVFAGLGDTAVSKNQLFQKKKQKQKKPFQKTWVKQREFCY